MTPVLASISDREEEILELRVEGLGRREIACRLGMSKHTVKHHLDDARHKLGVEVEAQATYLLGCARMAAGLEPE